MKAQFIIITGTNGAGKSTFGASLSAQSKMPFINVDIFYKEKFGAYREFSKEELMEASKELAQLRQGYFQSGQSFILERIITDTNSTKALLEQAKAHQFQTSLFYLGTENPLSTSESRINDRVKKGFHYVEPKIIEANLKDVIHHFKILAPLFDNVAIYNNTKDFAQVEKVMDIRDKKLYKFKSSLPKFAQELVRESFIDNAYKVALFKNMLLDFSVKKNVLFESAKEERMQALRKIYEKLSIQQAFKDNPLDEKEKIILKEVVFNSLQRKN